MENWIDLDDAGLMRLARSIERDCQEEVKWEIRKLEWILEDEKKLQQHEPKAA